MPIYQVYLVLYAQTTGSISLRSVFILRKPGDDGGRGAKFFQHRPTIVARWSHCASSYVYSVMIDWTSGGVARSTSISWYTPTCFLFPLRHFRSICKHSNSTGFECDPTGPLLSTDFRITQLYWNSHFLFAVHSCVLPFSHLPTIRVGSSPSPPWGWGEESTIGDCH